MRGPMALATLLLLAGCAGVSEPPADSAAPPVPRAPILVPEVSARETLDALRVFSTTFPYRQAESATHKSSRDWLETRMADAGLDALRQTFATGENIVGIRWGADRTNWIVVGAHYDVTEGAVGGAYDDGSGTLMTLMLGTAFAGVETNRTIAFVEFDQEERGLVGSEFFLDSVTDGSFPHTVNVVGMVDLDMIGITWPHPAKLVCWENSDEVKGFVEEARKAAGVPDGNVEYRKPRGGVSDGAVFLNAGIPTTYCWSDWDDVVLKDGTKAPPGTSYPWWHRADTYETMVAMAGDDATLEAGFQTTLDVMSHVVAHMASDAELDTR